MQFSSADCTGYHWEMFFIIFSYKKNTNSVIFFYHYIIFLFYWCICLIDKIFWIWSRSRLLFWKIVNGRSISWIKTENHFVASGCIFIWKVWLCGVTIFSHGITMKRMALWGWIIRSVWSVSDKCAGYWECTILFPW